MYRDKNENGTLFLILPIALLAAGVFLSLCTGKYPVDINEILVPGSLDREVFVHLRLGRTLAVLAAGTALSLAGHVFQTVFRNPLASPDIVGVAGGAGTGAAAAILLFGYAPLLTSAGAFIGGMAAVFFVLAVSSLLRRSGTVTILLSGVVANAFFQAVLLILKLCADTEQRLSSIEFWLMGSFASVTLEKLPGALVWIALGIAGIFAMRHRIALLSLPDGDAAMLGIDVSKDRMKALVFSTLITGAVISMTGLISFIGLLAPHISKRVVSEGKPGSLMYTALIGMDLMLYADVAARCITPSEIPVSVITSFIGAPLLLLLICRRRDGNE